MIEKLFEFLAKFCYRCRILQGLNFKAKAEFGSGFLEFKRILGFRPVARFLRYLEEHLR